jgi:tripartite-type tricarboxylate transporter receptor subunit TctC
MLTRRRFTRMATASALLPAIGGLAFAQPWPNRVVRLIVPFTPGGGIDAIGRIVGGRLSEIWGQQVVVENKPGAGANIGIEAAARSTPDGYTMLITAGGLAVNQFLFPSISYDPVADFAPVTLICLFPNLLVVPKDSKFNRSPTSWRSRARTPAS